MVIKTQTCRYSGLRVYPGRGIIFVRSDGQQFLFLSCKVKSYFHQRLRPQKIAWTTAYRKAHKKDQTAHIVRKRKTVQRKPAVRSIAGASLEIIQKKRNEQPEVRKASREVALREVKERMKKKQATAGKGAAAGGKSQASKYGKTAPRAAARTGKRA